MSGDPEWNRKVCQIKQAQHQVGPGAIPRKFQNDQHDKIKRHNSKKTTQQVVGKSIDFSVDGPDVFLLAGFDAKGKMILPRWQGAGGKTRKRARRAVSFVEVDDNFSGRVRR